MKTVIERLKHVVSLAEIKAIKAIMVELGDADSGIVSIAILTTEKKIGRSALKVGVRLLEATGVIETKSAGRDGTYIKILDRVTLDELIK